MRIRKWFSLLAIAGGLSWQVLAGPIETLDLKPFVGPSPFDNIGAPWLLPRGSQVMDGTPFQIDGAILLFSSNSAQRNRPGRTNVNDISVGKHFERLHLLAGAHSGTSNHTTIAKVRLQYTDGSDATLEVRYGEDIRNWFGPWHKTEPVLRDQASRVAWIAQCSAAAATDDYLRLYHVTLTNPSPDKEVRALSLESTRKASGLIVVAMSVGPAEATRQPDTVTLPKSPFPDLRPRSGESAPITGIVKSKDGKPLAGARLKLVEARDLGTNTVHSEVDDSILAAEVTADAEGKFSFPSVPDDHLYRVMAVAEDFQAFTYGGADPKSDPIEIRLSPQSEAATSRYVVQGRVIGPDGKPVSGATVETGGVSSGDGTMWGGSQGFPDQVLAGINGEFTLGRKDPFKRVQVTVKSRGLAPNKLWLDVSNVVQTVELTVGANIRGRVLKDGQPLAGVRVGVNGVDRGMEDSPGQFSATTDTNGVFVFRHLPPFKSWTFFGKMSSFKALGAIKYRQVQTDNNGETTELGDLNVIPALRLAGQVQTKKGEPLPKGLTVYMGNDMTLDGERVNVNKDGAFEFTNLPPGEVNLTVQQRGWHLTSAHRSLDMWNPFRLTGQLETNKDDLLLVIDKGEQQYYYGGGSNGQLPSQDQPQSRPLTGAEASGPAPILLGGKVVDDKTGQIVPKFKILPGYQPPILSATAPPKPLLDRVLEPFADKKKSIPWNERPFWLYVGQETNTDGNFSLTFAHLSSSPIFRIEAEGYEPYESPPTNTWNTNLVVRLTHGAGVTGTVLLPDGKPAEKATLIYAAAQEQYSLSGRKLNQYGSREWEQVTKADGKFSFMARSHGAVIFAAHPAGWGEEPVAHGGENLKLHLQPWAAVSGTLVNSNGAPMPNVELTLTMQHDWQSGAPLMHYQVRTNTDSAGRFFFPDVPPRRLELQRVIPMGNGGGWSSQLQTWFIAQPGLTNDLGKVTYDTPPPPTMVEQFKRKLGL